MTDADLAEKKLARIETCLTELETQLDPDEIVRDLRAERFAEHTLQIAIQAAQDAASHIVAAGRLGEPRTNRELFSFLHRNGRLTEEGADSLARMIGFRNRSCTAARSWIR